LGYNAQNAVVLSNRAMAFLKNREYSKAEDDCTLALKIDPSHVKSYSRRGTARNSLGKHRLALLDFEKAAELDPNSKQIDNQIVYTRDLIKSAIKRAPKRSDIKIQVVESSTNDSKKNISTEPIEPIEVIEDKENFAGNATLKTRGILTKTPIIKPILKTPQKTPAPPPAPLGATSKEPESTTAIHKAASTTSSSTSLPNLPKKAPTSSYEFGRVWKTLSLKGDAQRKKELLELQGEFIRKISPKSLPSVFKNSIESDLLCELFHAIRHCLYASDKSFVFDFVGGLTKVPRFSMTISFLTKKEKEDIEWVFNELTKDKGAKEVEDVKKLYQV
jgi:tetratricopeptide (TPR) repeat protein